MLYFFQSQIVLYGVLVQSGQFNVVSEPPYQSSDQTVPVKELLMDGFARMEKDLVGQQPIHPYVFWF